MTGFANGFGIATLLWTFAAIYVGFYVLRFVLVLGGMLKERVRHQPERRVYADEVPPHVRDALTQAAAQFDALSFISLGWTVSERTVPFADAPLYKLWLRSDERASFACVCFTVLSNPADLYRISFHTYGGDGRNLCTINGRLHFVPWQPPALILHDPYAATVSAQWDAHLSQLDAQGIVGETSMLLSRATTRSTRATATPSDAG